MNFPATVDSLSGLSLGGQALHLAIGVFDGVHRGHRAVVKAALSSARLDGGIAAVLTFWPHPSRLLTPDAPVPQILTPEAKSAIFHEMGVDLVLQIPFTQEFSMIEAAEFLPYLMKFLPGLASVSIGENFCFGRGRTGDIARLIEEAGKYDIEVFSSGRIKENGEEISSTRIRENLQSGHIGRANRLLGYPYFSYGPPVSGRGAGRDLGFPTINFPWAPELRPAYGVYAVELLPDEVGGHHPGVANYGVRPTVVADGDPVLEVHLFSFDGIKPGATCRVAWHRFLRPERKFTHVEDLIRQIALDKEEARGMLQVVEVSDRRAV